VIVVGGGVLLVVIGMVDVLDDPPFAVAIIGDALGAVGAALTIPVAALLFGYGVQVRLSVLPDTVSDNEMAGSTVRVIAPPEAVNGPTVTAVDGRISSSPVAGTGLGIGASIVIAGAAIVAGEAPVASTLSWAVPTMAEFPSAAAAETMEAGSDTVDW
jgi:hypothetical protein